MAGKSVTALRSMIIGTDNYQHRHGFLEGVESSDKSEPMLGGLILPGYDSALRYRG